MDKETTRNMKEGVMIMRQKGQSTRKEWSNGVGRMKEMEHYIRSCIVLLCFTSSFPRAFWLFLVDTTMHRKGR